MIDEYGQETYRILANLIKITFSKYLKNGGIEFGGIYQMRSLSNGVEFYLLEINDTQIRFKKPKDFLFHFMIFLKKNIEDYTQEYKRLTTRSVDEFTDEIGLEMRYKQIEFYIYQQTELLKLIKKHYVEVK